MGTGLALGGALGDGLSQSLAGHEIAAFDELGAPFWYSLGDLARAAPGPDLDARLRAFMAPAPALAAPEAGVLQPAFASLSAGAREPLRLGLMEAPPPGTTGGHLSLAGNALTLGAAPEWGGLRFATFAAEGRPGQAPATGAALSWRPARAPLGLRSGLVAERETLLGSRTAGAFGRVSSRSAFAGLEGSTALAGWRLDAGAEDRGGRRGRPRRDALRRHPAHHERLRPPGGAAAHGEAPPSRCPSHSRFASSPGARRSPFPSAGPRAGACSAAP